MRKWLPAPYYKCKVICFGVPWTTRISTLLFSFAKHTLFCASEILNAVISPSKCNIFRVFLMLNWFISLSWEARWGNSHRSCQGSVKPSSLSHFCPHSLLTHGHSQPTARSPLGSDSSITSQRSASPLDVRTRIFQFCNRQPRDRHSSLQYSEEEEQCPQTGRACPDLLRVTLLCNPTPTSRRAAACPQTGADWQPGCSCLPLGASRLVWKELPRCPWQKLCPATQVLETQRNN